MTRSEDRTHWMLLHQLDEGEPSEFFEVRLKGRSLWCCTGAAKTFGECQTKNYENLRQAETAFDDVISQRKDLGFVVSARGVYHDREFDFVEFKEAIKAGARRSLRQMRSSHPDSKICGFGLLTDGSPMTIVPVGQSIEAVSASDDKYASEAKWNVSAWSFDDGDRHFDIPYRMMLRQQRGDIPFEVEIDDHVFREGSFEAMIAALEELRGDEEFASFGRDFVLLIQVADSEPIDGMVERLNPDASAIRAYWEFWG